MLEPTSSCGPVVVAALLAPANPMWFEVWSLIEALLEGHRVPVTAHCITLGGVLIDADGGIDATMRRLGIDNRGTGDETGDLK